MATLYLIYTPYPVEAEEESLDETGTGSETWFWFRRLGRLMLRRRMYICRYFWFAVCGVMWCFVVEGEVL
jgi:hypothetical protein